MCTPFFKGARKRTPGAPFVTEAMVHSGFADDEIVLAMDRNQVRFLPENLL